MASFYENISGYTVTQTDKAYFTDIDVANEISVNGVVVDLVTLADLVNTPTFTGSISSLGLSVGDNNLINVGAGNDLQIYHDGSHSYIKDAGTGDLKIQGGNVAIQNISGGNIFFANSQAAFLDWRGTSGAGTKLQTTETGINVTGAVTADGVSLANDKRITLGAEAGSNYLEIFESTTGNGVIKQVGAGDFAIQGHAIQLKDDDGNLRFQGTNGAFGNAFLYYGADATPKLNTTSAGINVTGSVNAQSAVVITDPSPSLILKDSSDSDDHSIKFRGSDDADNLQITTHSNHLNFITADSNKNILMKPNGATALEVNTTGIDVTGTVEADNFLVDTGGYIAFEGQGSTDFASIRTVIDNDNGITNLDFRLGDDDADAFRWQFNHFNDGDTDYDTYMQLRADTSNPNKGVLTVTGTVTADGVKLGDNEKIQLGASQDLELFHDGTNSYVQDAGDGGLILNTTSGNGVFIHSATETMGSFHTNGAVNLYHDNAEKFATTATGIDVTGAVEADAFSGTGNTSITNFITDVSTNNNDTTVPTTAAVKTYVDANAAGGGETLAQTLVSGASTGGTDLAVSAGDNIVFSDTSKAIFQDEDGDPKLEIYSDAGSSNRSTIKSTGVSLYLEAPHINYNSGGNQYFRTSFSAGTAQFTIDGSSASTTTRGSIIQEATNSYTGSISAQTANITGGSAIPVIDCHKNVSTSNGDTLGSLKYFGENSSGQKSYYGEMSCTASNTSGSGNQVGQLEWYIADGSGQTVPVTNVNADNAGKKLAMVVGNTFTGFYGGNQLYLEGTNPSGDKGYLNFSNNQSLRPPLTSDTSKIYLPQTKADKVMSIGGIGTSDSWIFGTTMSETDFLKYRGQHMVRYGTTATATATFDLPKVQATNSGHSTTLGNIGDIYTISNVVGGALTIDRDASGTAQAVYELNGSSLVAFTNNPTISVGGSITLQAVGTNTYLIMNAKGLTDA